MDITLYGIANCDTVKRARAWLSERQLAYQFHDFKKSGVPEELLAVWLERLGWQALVNRQGLTWRKLDAAVQQGVCDVASARRLMLAQPSVIKRPVVKWSDGELTVGFQAEAWAARAPVSRPHA